MTMKTNPAPPLTLRDILLYALAYLLWLVNVVVCVAAVIQFRSTVNVLWVVLGGDRYSLGLVNQLSLLLGGLAAFIYTVFLEGYYRQSIARKGQKPQAGGDAAAHTPAPPSGRISQWLSTVGLTGLLRRFAITTAVPLGLVVVSLVMTKVAWRGLH
jgi:hypothetical protein